MGFPLKGLVRKTERTEPQTNRQAGRLIGRWIAKGRSGLARGSTLAKARNNMPIKLDQILLKYSGLDDWIPVHFGSSRFRNNLIQVQWFAVVK
jgi:hypothetical protein